MMRNSSSILICFVILSTTLNSVVSKSFSSDFADDVQGKRYWGQFNKYSGPHLGSFENPISSNKNNLRYIRVETSPKSEDILIREKKLGNSSPRSGNIQSHKGNPIGCVDSSGFHFDGEAWHTKGCRRNKCLYFRGSYFVETDSCDAEIYNTTYKCIIRADLEANYPKCCPRYYCNPDNLGNRVKGIVSGTGSVKKPTGIF